MPKRKAARSFRPLQYELRIELADIDPRVWRRVRVPDAYTLHQLHRVIQLAFCWLDYHLYEFTVGERSFQAPDQDSEAEDSTRIRLHDLALRTGGRFAYVYDFGDYWEHDLAVEHVLPMPDPHGPDWTPRITAGAGAAPPEDIGGPHQYSAFLKELRGEAAPQPAFPAREILGADFDPALFDLRAADHALTLASAWRAV